MAGLAVVKLLKNIKDGSKVITSPVTYIATANAIVKSNLRPVFVDIDREKFGILPEKIEELLKKKISQLLHNR